jgi:hypothetical protein
LNISPSVAKVVTSNIWVRKNWRYLCN